MRFNLSAAVYPENNATTVTFVYGTGSSTRTTIAQTIGGGTTGVNVSVPVTGLLPNASYYFYVIAQRPTARLTARSKPSPRRWPASSFPARRSRRTSPRGRPRWSSIGLAT